MFYAHERYPLPPVVSAPTYGSIFYRVVSRLPQCIIIPLKEILIGHPDLFFLYYRLIKQALQFLQQ